MFKAILQTGEEASVSSETQRRASKSHTSCSRPLSQLRAPTNPRGGRDFILGLHSGSVTAIFRNQPQQPQGLLSQQAHQT